MIRPVSYSARCRAARHAARLVDVACGTADGKSSDAATVQ